MAASWTVYLLECADGTYYIGSTTDLARRLKEHNGPNGAKYTKARQPVVVRYAEQAPDRSSAQAREAALKKLSRAEKRALMEAS
ncbi:MAG TPA: GIY-YIG nuclease family protein [Candidatus Paceibacterota bacterium]|nr:GIY-YIG nuclease family protein [Candidatus Paceibacterota bacterium]